MVSILEGFQCSSSYLGLSGGARGVDEGGTVTRFLLLNPPLDLIVGHVVTNLHELRPRHHPLVPLLCVHWLWGVLDYGFQVRETVTHLQDRRRRGGGGGGGGRLLLVLQHLLEELFMVQLHVYIISHVVCVCVCVCEGGGGVQAKTE